MSPIVFMLLANAAALAIFVGIIFAIIWFAAKMFGFRR